MTFDLTRGDTVDDRTPTAPSEEWLEYRLANLGDETSFSSQLHPLIIEQLLDDTSWCNAHGIVTAIHHAIEEYAAGYTVEAPITPEIKAALLANYLVSLIIDHEVQREALGLIVKGYPAEV